MVYAESFKCVICQLLVVSTSHAKNFVTCKSGLKICNTNVTFTASNCMHSGHDHETDDLCRLCVLKQLDHGTGSPIFSFTFSGEDAATLRASKAFRMVGTNTKLEYLASDWL